jgi:uncharacterized membrane protein YvbJ
MANFCSNCGHELRERDKFCSECATPVGGAATQAQPERSEYCEITWTKKGFFIQAQSYFWAKDLACDLSMRGRATSTRSSRW